VPCYFEISMVHTERNETHVNLMDWNEFHQIVKRLIDQLSKMNITFDAVTPILRSGAVPATMIANKLKIIPTIPVQVKYNYTDDCIDKIIPPVCPRNRTKENIKNILVVDSNTYTGGSAGLVAQLLNEEFPDAKLHYVCVTKVFGGKEMIDGYSTYTVGQITNEAFTGDAPNDARYGITIFPWETAQYELDDINAEN